MLYNPGDRALDGSPKVIRMLQRNQVLPVVALIFGACLSGCQKSPENGTPPTEANSLESSSKVGGDAGSEGSGKRSPGKPTAPVSIEYDIVGKAVVGQPVGINLRVQPNRQGQAVTLHYRVNDSSAMLFPESQAQRIDMPASDDKQPRLQQVTVIPQREGRLFLNVSAEVETENGAMFRSLAIPIQVGAGSRPPAVNGEVRETADGETVISMPASESGGG